MDAAVNLYQCAKCSKVMAAENTFCRDCGFDAFSRACNAAALLLIMATVLIFSGCAGQRDNLKSDDCERVKTDKTHYLRCSKETVNRRCTLGKQTWDDGSKFDPKDTAKWARCCIVFPTGRMSRYQIYVTRGEEECLPHELGHLEIYEADGRNFIPEHHKRLHDFGFGRPKKRL